MFLLQNSFLIWAIIVLAKVKWRRLVVSMWTASLRRREWPVTKSKATCCRRGWVNQYSEVLDRAFCIHQLRIWWSIQTLDFLFSVMQQPKSGLGRHAGKVSKPSTITHTLTHTHTHGIRPLKQSPDRRSDRYLYNTQQTKDTNIHAFIGARTRDTRNQEAVDLCLRPHDHRAWQYSIYLHIFTAHKVSHNSTI